MTFAVLESTYELIEQKLEGWLQHLILMLPNFVSAIIIFILFLLAGRLVRSLTIKVFNRFSKNHSISVIIGGITGLIVSVTGLFIALGVLQLEKTVTSLLAGAGIVGLALSFAFQDLASNIVGGFLIAFNKNVNVGDQIQVKDITGMVEKTNLRTIQIRTFTGQRVFIPARYIIQEPLTNFTSTGVRRLDLHVGVSYGEDLRRVKDIVINALTPLDCREQETSIELFWDEFDNSSINFFVRLWLSNTSQKEYLSGKSEAIMVIHETFRKENITIPFPIRTLDFGIKGGEKLHESLILSKRNVK